MTPEYRDWLTDLFAPLGRVSLRRVFGSHGLYVDGVMFGIVSRERIYLKTDAASRKSFERDGSKALVFTTRKGEHIVTSYFEVPERLYDESDELSGWARQAYEIAAQSPTATRKRGRVLEQDGARQPARRRRSR